MVTLEKARKVIAAAEKKAAEIKQPMNIAVVDEGGNLVSLCDLLKPGPNAGGRPRGDRRLGASESV